MFINLTPHVVNVFKDKKILSIPPSGIIARCEQQEQLVGAIDGIEVLRMQLGKIIDLPPAKKGVIYIVSHIVLQQAAERKDLVKPGVLVRDENGAVIGCRNLCCM